MRLLTQKMREKEKQRHLHWLKHLLKLTHLRYLMR